MGVGLVELQSHPFALDHPLGKSCCLLAVVLNWFVWVLGFWCVHTNEADPFLVLHNESVAVYHSPYCTVLSRTFPKWVD